MFAQPMGCDGAGLAMNRWSAELMSRRSAILNASVNASDIYSVSAAIALSLGPYGNAFFAAKRRKQTKTATLF